MYLPAVVLAFFPGDALPRLADPFGAAVWVRAEGEAAGGGVVVGSTQRVVTARHVVGDHKQVDVYFRWYEAGRLVTDKAEYLRNRDELKKRGLLVSATVTSKVYDADLAVLLLPGAPPGTVPARLAKAVVTTPVRAVGHRLDRETLWNVSAGVVRTAGRLETGYPWQSVTLARGAGVLVGQFDAEEGDSGGPAFDPAGRLVGMVVARGGPGSALIISADEIGKRIAVPPLPADPAPSASPFLGRLTAATVWVRPADATVHRAGVVVGPAEVLTTANGLTAGSRVGLAFHHNGGERVIYADTVGLHLAGAWRTGTVAAVDPARDLAVIHLDTPVQVVPASVAERPPLPGDPVHAVGHPRGLEFAWVYSTGVVRQRGRAKLADGDAPTVGATLFQLPPHPAAPGGPVVNARGELVGVLSSRDGYAADVDEIAAFRAMVPKADPVAAAVGAGVARAFAVQQAVAAKERPAKLAAIGTLQLLLDIDPADDALRRRMGDLLIAVGDGDRARAAFADAARVE